MKQRRNDVLFISPIVGGEAIKGPTAKIMREKNLDPSCKEIGKHYLEYATKVVIDQIDEKMVGEIESIGYEVYLYDTIMDDLKKKENLARFILSIL